MRGEALVAVELNSLTHRGRWYPLSDLKESLASHNSSCEEPFRDKELALDQVFGHSCNRIRRRVYRLFDSLRGWFATTSLPVPVSPSGITVAPVGAMRSRIPNISRMRVLFPTIRPNFSRLTGRISMRSSKL